MPLAGCLADPGQSLPLRCQEDPKWRTLLAELSQGILLFQRGEYAVMRIALADAIKHATDDLPAAFHCSIGLASAYRVLALAHGGDPALQGRAFLRAAHVALRLQHLANMWLIYAYNEEAHHDVAYIDGSAWPITTREFDAEHHTMRQIVAVGSSQIHQKAGVDASGAFVTSEPPSMSLGIVTLCAYPLDHPLPRLAGSNHRLYAERHGYDYMPSANVSTARGRPLAWGKISVMEDAINSGRWDWVLWIDCDIYFMNLSVSVESVLLRAGSSDYVSLDPGVHLLLTEDGSMLNTAVFAMRSSPWSSELLRQVWGVGDRESPFVNHTWWEQAAFAWHLLSNNTYRFSDVDYWAWA